jgi:cytoskeletal protein RodZ
MTIGQTIKAARVEQGLSIEELSEKTRIRPALLEGIELDDFTACGGDTYARGHIRSISTALSLDGAALLDRFVSQEGAPARASTSVAPIEQPTRIMEKANRSDGLRQLAGSLGIQDSPSGGLWLPIVSVIVMALVAAGLFVFFTHRGSNQAQPVVVVTETPSPTATPSSSPSQDPSTEPSSIAGPTDTPSTDPSADTASPDAAASDSATPDPPVSPIYSSGTTVEVTVTGQAAWVSAAKSKGGESIFEGLLTAGETKTFTSDTTIYLVVGDAGAVSLRVNGYDLGTLGSAGKVVRHEYGPGNPTQ